MHPRGQPNIVILTGAGVSKESGLDTFRDKGGIWSTVRIEDVATPDAFARDPDAVQAFYNSRRKRLIADGEARVLPNPAHAALARLEAAWPADLLLVTQNIDNLHESAGSRNLVHMHGELLKSRCAHCADVRPCTGDLSCSDACPACGRAGGLRPHVVWFGEMPLEMDRIEAALADCGLFLSIGTSGNVYPAAGFVAAARNGAGARTIELNLEPSAGHDQFADARYGPASQVVPAYVDELLAGL